MNVNMKMKYTITGGRRNMKAMMDVRSSKIDRIRYARITWAMKVVEISKKLKEVEVVWACQAKRGALRRKEGDGNGNSRDEKGRKAYEKNGFIEFETMSTTKDSLTETS